MEPLRNRYAAREYGTWQVYVLGEGESLRETAMQCACGCGERVYLNLLPTANPCFSVASHSDGTVSLYPTIQRQSGCRIHLFVRRSRVYRWHRETGIVNDGSGGSTTYSMPLR